MLTDDPQSTWIPVLGYPGTLLGYVLIVVGLWQVFGKAGIPTWWAIVPVLNVWGVLKIAGFAWWWLLLLLIPLVNIVLALVVAMKLGQKFRRGGVFSFFLLFLIPAIGYLIVGFGRSRYDADA